MEQRNTGGIIGIPRSGGTGEEQRNNGTAKQHQEILPNRTITYLADSITKFKTRKFF